ncbi:DUF397 domain-containing protein [Streptomyces adelaidensis]|uniref:DUF397 domain-containing protein n=1 Tax=Streptomyces adelaidensis TaxID=2796465 RepID=UPI001907A1AA|nr:DUF397 domain-containing protein [Streptomyces adelaidensis]
MARLGWQKSSYSEGGADTCIELATGLVGTSHLREGDTPVTVIAITTAAPCAFHGGVKRAAVHPAKPASAPG